MIEKTLKETLPESIHPHVTTLQEDIYEAQAIENKLKGIILFFSIVSLLITLLGVYSTITLDTERRQKEVAIRKVNGAGLKQIILLFARLYIKLLTVSAIIAFPLIYIVIQMWKKHILYSLMTVSYIGQEFHRNNIYYGPHGIIPYSENSTN